MEIGIIFSAVLVRVPTQSIRQYCVRGIKIFGLTSESPEASEFSLLDSIEDRPLHLVVGINGSERKLIIITAYEPDSLKWSENYSWRIK